MRFRGLMIVLLCCFSQFSYAQDPVDTTKVVVTTADGKERVGIILEDDGREILLLTELLGKIYIRKSEIKSIIPATEVTLEKFHGDYRSSGPFTTRYYFTTNALTIKKNEDYSMIHLYGPEVHFSLTDRFSLGVMSTWIASPLVLALKYTIPTKNEQVNFGFGSLVGTSGYLNTFRGYGGLHWGMVTVGDRMMNFTLSAGYSYAELGSTSDDDLVPGVYGATPNGWGGTNYPVLPTKMNSDGLITSPVVSFAGIVKVGKKASFIFDSMLFFSSQKRVEQYQSEIFNQDGTLSAVVVTEETNVRKPVVLILMPGMRFQHRDDRAFQIALAGFTTFESGEEVTSFPAPMCSWFFKF